VGSAEKRLRGTDIKARDLRLVHWSRRNRVTNRPTRVRKSSKGRTVDSESGMGVVDREHKAD
jgi:hypothetical protein